MEKEQRKQPWRYVNHDVQVDLLPHPNLPVCACPLSDSGSRISRQKHDPQGSLCVGLDGNTVTLQRLRVSPDQPITSSITINYLLSAKI